MNSLRAYCRLPRGADRRRRERYFILCVSAYWYVSGVCLCVCMCVCVREREDRGWQKFLTHSCVHILHGAVFFKQVSSKKPAAKKEVISVEKLILFCQEEIFAQMFHICSFTKLKKSIIIHGKIFNLQKNIPCSL